MQKKLNIKFRKTKTVEQEDYEKKMKRRFKKENTYTRKEMIFAELDKIY
jgi:hypothetical protein